MSFKRALNDAKKEVREAYEHYEESRKWHRKFCQQCREHTFACSRLREELLALLQWHTYVKFAEMIGPK